MIDLLSNLDNISWSDYFISNNPLKMFCCSRLYNRVSRQKMSEISLLLIRITANTKGKKLPTASTFGSFFIEVQWCHHQYTFLWIEWSRFKPWLGTICSALGQDTVLSQCLSRPWCIDGHQRINAVGQCCVRLASHPGGSRNTPSLISMLQWCQPVCHWTGMQTLPFSFFVV